MSQTEHVVVTRELLEREILALRQAVRELYACAVHGADGCGPHDYQRDAADEIIYEPVAVDEDGTPIERAKVYPVDTYIVDHEARAAALRAVEALP